MFSLLRRYWPAVSERVESLSPRQFLGGLFAVMLIATQLQEAGARAVDAAFELSRGHPLLMGLLYVALAWLTLVHTQDEVKTAPRGTPAAYLAQVSATCYMVAVMITFIAAVGFMWTNRWPAVAGAPNAGVLLVALAFHVVMIPAVGALMALASPALFLMMALASFMGLLPGMASPLTKIDICGSQIHVAEEGARRGPT